MGPAKTYQFPFCVQDMKQMQGNSTVSIVEHKEVFQDALYSMAGYQHHLFAIRREKFPDPFEHYEDEW